jgi:hypothetical protein
MKRVYILFYYKSYIDKSLIATQEPCKIGQISRGNGGERVTKDFRVF